MSTFLSTYVNICAFLCIFLTKNAKITSNFTLIGVKSGKKNILPRSLNRRIDSQELVLHFLYLKFPSIKSELSQKQHSLLGFELGHLTCRNPIRMETLNFEDFVFVLNLIYIILSVALFGFWEKSFGLIPWACIVNLSA